MQNLGTKDRVARTVAGAPLLVCSLMAPLPLLARIGLMAVPGAYLLGSALFGSCLGYDHGQVDVRTAAGRPMTGDA